MPSRGATISIISIGLAIFGIIFVGISFMTFDETIEDNDELIYIGTQDEVYLTIIMLFMFQRTLDAVQLMFL